MAYRTRLGFWLVLGAVVGGASAIRDGDGKTQAVRLVDVFALGPFLSWVAMRRRVLLPGSRALLAAAGAATVTYNAVNWMRQHQGAPLAPKAGS